MRSFNKFCKTCLDVFLISFLDKKNNQNNKKAIRRSQQNRNLIYAKINPSKVIMLKLH